MRPDIDDIIRRAQSGDRQAFAELIEQQYDRVFRIALQYSGSRSDAEDITQQACIKLARFIGHFRFESTFSTWLYRLVINCARDWFKSPSRRVHDSLSEVPQLALNVPDSSAEAQILLRQVLERVESMGDGYRETVLLVIGEGLTHNEAARVLEISEKTVSWRLHEIRKRLKVEMQPEDSV